MDLHAELLRMCRGVASLELSDDEFNRLALRAFAYQFERNAVLRAYCLRRGCSPDRVQRWDRICAMPVLAFKDGRLGCVPEGGVAKTFCTGGTSDPKRRGRVHHSAKSLQLAEATNREVCKRYLFPDVERIRLLVMAPPPALVPDMYMAYGLEVTMRAYGTPDSRFFIGRNGLDLGALVAALEQAERTGEPVALIGPTNAAFGRLLEHCRETSRRFRLPPGSRVIDAGGSKGSKVQLGKSAFALLKNEILGVPDELWANVLGMTEVVSLFYDTAILDRHLGRSAPRAKAQLPWTRTVAVDPATLERVEKRQVGILRHFDLLNLEWALCVQTEDLGYETDGGFEIVGRIGDAERKGCALTVEDLASGAARR